MPIIAFIGCQGSGKTLSMVREAKKDADNGLKIYSNIKLKGIEHEQLDLKWFYGYLIKGNELNNVVVLIDEIHLFADSRESRSNVNKVLGYFALQSRKRNVKFYFTVQYFDTVDKRIRMAALDDMIIKCDGEYIYASGEKELKQIKQTILYKDKLFKRLILKPSLYYQFYDTSQVLTPIEDKA